MSKKIKKPLKGDDKKELIKEFKAAKAAILEPLDKRNDLESEKIRARVQNLAEIRFGEAIDAAIQKIEQEGGISRVRKGMLRSLMDLASVRLEMITDHAERLPVEQLKIFTDHVEIFHERFSQRIGPLLDDKKTPTIEVGTAKFHL